MKVHQQQGTKPFIGKYADIKNIVLSGKLQSGKDTSRKILSHMDTFYIHPDNMSWGAINNILKWDDYNYKIEDNKCYSGSFQHLFFARNVKSMCSVAVYGEIRPEVFTEEIKDKQIEVKSWSHFTWRQLFQWFGTNVCRDKDPDFWIRSIDGTLEAVPENRRTFITDCRFPNEANMSISKPDTILIRIDRNEDVVDLTDPNIPKELKNESEMALDTYQSFHEIVLNHGDIYRLYRLLWDIYHKYEMYIHRTKYIH